MGLTMNDTEVAMPHETIADMMHEITNQLRAINELADDFNRNLYGANMPERTEEKREPHCMAEEVEIMAKLAFQARERLSEIRSRLI